MSTKKITTAYLVEKFDCPQIADQITKWLKGVDTTYTVCSSQKLQEYIMFVLRDMVTPRASRTPQQNLDAWKTGWAQHLAALKKPKITINDLKPKYFRPASFFRFNKQIVQVKNKHIEYDLFTVVRKIIFLKYFSGYGDIYEVGCGSGHNLWMLAKLFPDARLHGFDWAKPSNTIANNLSHYLSNQISGTNFDMMKLPKEKLIKPGSAVLTIHAMEQLGENFEDFINYVIECRPALVVNYEPIIEMYDQNCLTDYMAYFYSVKRNYLNGFWSFLENLAAKRKIEIVKAIRPYIGGVIHEASLIVWRPL